MTTAKLKIRVLLFAAAAEIARTDQLQFSLEHPTSDLSGQQLFAAIASECPELAELLPSCRLAVDGKFVALTDELSAHAELALIPPVSGG
jgi:molybdopterin synthase catalytic subunit/molybdopterin synthase sulfur carrier subunit